MLGQSVFALYSIGDLPVFPTYLLLQKLHVMQYTTPFLIHLQPDGRSKVLQLLMMQAGLS